MTTTIVSSGQSVTDQTVANGAALTVFATAASSWNGRRHDSQLWWRRNRVVGGVSIGAVLNGGSQTVYGEIRRIPELRE